MIKYFKTLIFLLSVILFCSLAGSSFAQYPGMARVYSNMNQQMMNQQMNNMMMTMGMLNGDKYYNPKNTYVVRLKDSSKISVTSKMFTDTSLHKNYLIYTDKNLPKSNPKHEQKIYPDQTIEILYDEPTIAGGTPRNLTPPKTIVIPGIAKDSCWMFKIISGPISVYSYIYNGLGEDSPTISAIQLNSGPLVKYNEENLTVMVEQDADALKYIKKKNFIKSIKRYNEYAKK